MLAYLFTIVTPENTTEFLGYLQMPSDAEAIAFGNRVVEDLQQYDDVSGWAIMVTEGTRDVGCLVLQDNQAANPERSGAEHLGANDRRTAQASR